MVKILAIPEPIPKELIPREGKTATIAGVRLVRDQFTSIGTVSLGLGLTVNIDGDEYSHLFSLDREVITGSIGRLLASIGMTDLPANPKEDDFKLLVGKRVRIVNRGGRLYWYP